MEEKDEIVDIDFEKLEQFYAGRRVGHKADQAGGKALRFAAMLTLAREQLAQGRTVTGRWPTQPKIVPLFGTARRRPIVLLVQIALANWRT